MTKLIGIVLFAVLVAVFVVIFSKVSSDQYKSSNVASVAPKEQTYFTARFGIYTNGAKRVFTAAMYHNQSPDVFIQNPDPSVVYVKKAGITWDDFFKTLSFSVTKDCLVTGTKETFCSNPDKRLAFILNGRETPDILNLEINPNDHLEVRYE